MIRTTMKTWCSILLCCTLASGVSLPALFIQTAEAKAPSFYSGLESKDGTLPAWVNESEASENVNDVQSQITNEKRQSGAQSLLFSGISTSVNHAAVYNKVFDVNIDVNDDTTLSYWVYPQSEENSRSVAVDLAFEDGTYLHNYDALDQHGVQLQAKEQGEDGALTLDTWNFVTSKIGSAVSGKTIKRILVTYERVGRAGSYKAFFDELQIRNADFDPTLYADPLLGSQNNKLDIIGFGGNRGNTFPGQWCPSG
ncbi:hypothetical protein [Paenibacillus hexagrammi]|uniref:Uncharacterized protein n=1 Tax=Paenibacillus hexagrammi TaxID=2908839 RepID=A0ABY3SP37_9BACL|nr:hypothetical protein [Paenibacillus sp. YPD9-1]UJF35190.1 hypothetical protein L0M14_08725 [Paenibacillus sp. YPD9-1]